MADNLAPQEQLEALRNAEALMIAVKPHEDAYPDALRAAELLIRLATC